MIEQWKNDLTERLETFCRIAKTYNQALQDAEKYLSRSHSYLSGYKSIPTIVQDWLFEICKAANNEVENISHIKITPKLIPTLLQEVDFPRELFDASNEMLASWVIENFKFEALKVAIEKAKKNIQQIGLNSCAEEMILKFGLRNNNHGVSAIDIKQQKSRYVVNIAYYGNWVMDRVKSLEHLKSLAFTFEREADVVGLSYCLQMLINEEMTLNKAYNIWVPSRTKVAQDGMVSATFFKDKIQFAFEPEIFEALISFIHAYKNATTEIKKIDIK